MPYIKIIHLAFDLLIRGKWEIIDGGPVKSKTHL